MRTTTTIDPRAVENAIAAAFEHAPASFTRDIASTRTREKADLIALTEKNAQSKREVEQTQMLKDAVLDDLRKRLPDAENAELQHAINVALLGDAGPDGYFDSGFSDDWGGPPKHYPALIEGFYVDNMYHVGSGKHGALKSTVGAWGSKEAIAAGRDVIWLDWEVGKDQARARLWLAGVRDGDLVRKHFNYRNGPDVSPEGMAQMLEAIAGMNAPFVVIDSMSKALASLGFSENDNSDVSKYMTQVIVPMKAAGATIYAIDHIGRNQSASSDYVGRGASTKDADADITYRFDVTVEPDQETIGTLRVVCQKDRESALKPCGLWQPSRAGGRGERWFAVGDGKGSMPVTPIDQPAEAHAAGREAAFRIGVVKILEENPRDTFSLNDLKSELRLRQVTFKNDTFSAQVRELARGPSVPVKEDKGKFGFDPSVAEANGTLSF